MREYLQSDEFKERFADLIPYLAKVKKNNSNGEQTEDFVFSCSQKRSSTQMKHHTNFMKIRRTE